MSHIRWRILLAVALLPGLPGLASPEGKRVPVRGGEVLIPDARGQTAYDEWHYAPARRAGDVVYISGVVIAPVPGAPRTPDGFATAARTAFRRIESMLAGFGLTFEDVVMINSFHDWSAPEFAGDRLAQFKAFSRIKDEFIPGKYPAWTAVGTSGLIRPEGIVEVQMIAHVPSKDAGGH